MDRRVCSVELGIITEGWGYEMFFGAKIKKKKERKTPNNCTCVGLREHGSSQFRIFFHFRRGRRESGFIRFESIALLHCFRDIGGENAIIGTENGNRVAGVCLKRTKLNDNATRLAQASRG